MTSRGTPPPFATSPAEKPRVKFSNGPAWVSSCDTQMGWIITFPSRPRVAGLIAAALVWTRERQGPVLLSPSIL